jgi:hypothetical protein
MAAQGQSVLAHRIPSKPNGARRNAGAVCIAATASAAIASITVRENQSSKFVDRTQTLRQDAAALAIGATLAFY